MKKTANVPLALAAFPMGLPLSSLPGHTKIKSEPRDPDGPPGRKRQRLDHLTIEEKIMRRKLKNRVAAQSARDRKKVLMDQLEDESIVLNSAMEALQAENTRLQAENAVLQDSNLALRVKAQRCEELQRENERLLLQLDEQKKSNAANHPDGDHRQSLEHASLISVSQQKRQDSVVAARLMMLCIGWTMLILTTSTTSCKSLKKSSIRRVLQLMMWRQFQKRNPQLKWWGPQQNSWNPSKN